MILRGAYTQLASKPEHAFAAVVSMLNDRMEEVVFIASTLLFGQTSAVYNFNRVSKLLDAIAAKMAMLLTTCYYDDFPCVGCAPLADSAERTFKDMLNILGIQASEDSDKDKPFDQIFEPLGVDVDLTDSTNGKIVVAPKPKRIETIRNIVSGILGRGAMRARRRPA